MIETFVEMCVDTSEKSRFKRLLRKISLKVGYYDHVSFGKTNKYTGYHFTPFEKLYGYLIVNVHQWLSSKNLVCHGIYGPRFNKGARRRQNTAYIEDEKNYIFVCEKCFEEIQEYWEERWEDYNSSRL